MCGNKSGIASTGTNVVLISKEEHVQCKKQSNASVVRSYGKISYRFITSMSTISLIKIALSLRGYVTIVLTGTRNAAFCSERCMLLLLLII